MNNSIKYLCTLLWVITTITVALLIFTGGFLLKRIEVQEYSSCDSGSLHSTFDDAQLNASDVCWMPASFQKAVIIVIDALRYDFLKLNKSTGAEQPFQNKLITVNEKLTRAPDRSALYKFIADPPTTTMQRLKGLTTGSLPTFVDAGANFAGSNIVEDNIIDQLKKQQKRMIFMGDDTWLDLFPSQFSVQYPFPSLNVKDLDTVDNGVINNIFNEMSKTDWDVIIGHFLGVDHCGHTFGPYHPVMAQKLTQMDEVLRKIMLELPAEAILVVLGDHGMTRTGDHGGDSVEELEAGLFVYSNKPIKSPKLSKETSETVAQIDLVPTLSLLLGLPIPFSNLGKVIPELFTVCPKCTGHIDALLNEAKASHLNSNQVRKYLQSYSKVSDEFPHQELLELEKIFHSASEQYQRVDSNIRKGVKNEEIPHLLKNVTATYQGFLHGARLMCDRIWAQFDVFSMTIGMVYFLLCSVFFIQLDDPSFFNKLTLFGIVLNVLVLPCLVVFILTNVNLNGFVLYSCVVVSIFPACSYALFKVMSSEQDRLRCGKWMDFKYTYATSTACVAVFVLHLFGYLSNSYVVFDDSVTSFMVQSLVWIMFYKINVSITNNHLSKKNSKFHNTTKKISGKKFDIGRVFTSPRTLLTLLCVTLCCSLRFAKHFRPCREEQWTCETSQFMQPISAIADNIRLYKNIRYFFSAACVGVVVCGVNKWLRYCGNLNGHSASVMVTKYLTTLMGICVVFYWAFQALPKPVLEKFKTWQQDLFAQLGYVNFLITFVIIIIKPLSIYVLPREKEESVPFVTSADHDLVPKMYNHLKVNWQTMLTSKGPNSGQSEQGNGRTPVVYGLGTVYSAAFIMLIGSFSVLLAMLLGDGVTPGLVLQLLVMFIFLEIHACCVRSGSASEKNLFLVPWYSIIAWCLISSHFFYATGHQATIPAIRFESAYVGFHGDFTVYIVPVILILFNTFASHALGILALPLLLFWPCVRGKLIYFFDKDGGEDQRDDQRGELVLHEESEQFEKGLFNLFMSYFVISTSKVLVAMLAAGIHKRHLMVWKIFAPRFLYEAAIFLFSSFMLIFVYLIVLRVNKAVSDFIKKLS